MKYFNCKGRQQKHLPDLNTLSLKKRIKNRQRRSIIHPLCRFSRRWTPFDTSIENVAQTYGKFDPARAKWIPTHSISVWKKDGMIPGFIEGLENYLLVIRPFYSYPLT
jgi:hypothetical protein